MDYLTSALGLGGWTWVILGLVLMILEAIVPGVFLIWFGTAAIVTGVVSVMFDLGLSAQFLTFGVFAAISVLFGWRYGQYAVGESDRPNLNVRGRQYVGRTFELEEDIVNGQGRMKVGDSTWRVNGPDAKVGATVRVTGVKGASLEVELAE
ncbi:MAG: NfeD family protein [Hyphomicrobiaceae bacterium]